MRRLVGVLVLLVLLGLATAWLTIVPGSWQGAWRLDEVVRSPAPVVAQEAVTLTFRGSELRYSTGCNAITGTALRPADRLYLLGGQRTLLGCEEPRAGQEAWMTRFLGAHPKLSLRDGRLVLSGADAELAYRRA